MMQSKLDRDVEKAYLRRQADEEEATVEATWTCSMGSEDRARYVKVPTPWWDKFAVGLSVGILYCLALDWIF